MFWNSVGQGIATLTHWEVWLGIFVLGAANLALMFAVVSIFASSKSAGGAVSATGLHMIGGADYSGDRNYHICRSVAPNAAWRRWLHAIGDGYRFNPTRNQVRHFRDAVCHLPLLCPGDRPTHHGPTWTRNISPGDFDIAADLQAARRRDCRQATNV